MKFRPFRGFTDRTMIFVGLLALGSGLICYFLKGPEVFFESFSSDVGTFLSVAPRMGGALLLAAYIQLLVPRDLVARHLGEKSGSRGVALATGVGVLTPGGPMTSFPVVSALYEAGTGRSALIAYLTSWSVLGATRVITWEIPLLGMEFAILRELTSIPLPFIAAAISAFLPSVFDTRKRP